MCVSIHLTQKTMVAFCSGVGFRLEWASSDSGNGLRGPVFFTQGLGCGGKAGEPESWRNQTRPEIKSYTPENKGNAHSVQTKTIQKTQTTPALVIIKTKQIHHRRKNRDGLFSVFCALGGGKVFQMESSLRREKQPRQTKQPRSQIKGPNKKLTSFSDAMSLQKAQENPT